MKALSVTRGLIRSTSSSVSELVGKKERKSGKHEEPWYKWKIKGDIKSLHKDLNHIEEWRKKQLKYTKEGVKKYLETKYHVEKKAQNCYQNPKTMYSGKNTEGAIH